MAHGSNELRPLAPANRRATIVSPLDQGESRSGETRGFAMTIEAARPPGDGGAR